jgi:hypothetical protein
MAEGEIIDSQIADITVKMAYHASKIKEHQLELQKLQEKRTKLIIKILEQD